MSMPVAEPLRPAVVLSLALHVLLAGFAVVSARQAHGSHRTGTELGAAWAGDTFEVEEVLRLPAREPAGQPEVREPNAEPKTAQPSPVAPARGDKPRAQPKASKPSPGEAGPSAAPPPPATTAAAGAPVSEAKAGAAPAASAEPGGAAATDGASMAGSSGAAPKTADFAKAFAKAVTAATHRDPIWDELPLGSAGVAQVAIRVDEDGRITTSSLQDEERVPAAIARLVERTLGFLRAGRFALSGAQTGAGVQVLRIEVVLSTVEPAEDYDDPRHTVSLGFDPPRLGQVGRAYFVHASGRRFEAKIAIVDAG